MNEDDDDEDYAIAGLSDDEDEYKDEDKFIDYLADCPSMILGFQLSIYSPDDDRPWCFCPLAKRVCNDQIPNYLPRCTGANSMTTPALIAHLRDKQKPDKWHWLALRFLEELYRDYMVDGKLHRAFYPPLSDDYAYVAAQEMENIEKCVHMVMRSALVAFFCSCNTLVFCWLLISLSFSLSAPFALFSRSIYLFICLSIENTTQLSKN